MSDQSIEFLNFEQAVEAAKKAHDVEFIGIRFNSPYRKLDAYIITVASDDPDYVSVSYSGGNLFDSFGEEDFYDEADAPDDAKTVFYAHQRDLGNGHPQVMGMNSEYVLFEVLPGLQEPDAYPSKAAFTQEAARVFTKFWRQT